MPNDFVDYYELLEISPNASTNTIERVFRYMAKSCHPDVAGESQRELFQSLVSAFETLKDPERRAAYDHTYQQEQADKTALVENANEAVDDQTERYNLLSLFYAKRRRNHKEPGVGPGTLETMVSCPANVLEFHLWYFREKGWVQREPSGQFSITADGVDQIDQMNQPRMPTNSPKLEHQTSRRINRAHSASV